MTQPRLVLLAAAAVFGAPAFAATIITSDTIGPASNNGNVAANYGGNVSAGTGDFTVSSGLTGITGTPDIALAWAATSSTWQYHSNSGAFAPVPTNPSGGALQLDSSTVGTTYSITFTPGASSAVRLNSFNFENDTGGAPNVNYNYTLNLVDLTTSVTIYTAGYVFNPSVQTSISLATATINTTGTTGHAVRLDIVRSAATSGAEGSGNDIYIDNLSFDQITAIPEPSTYGLLGAGALVASAFARRRKVG